MCKNIIFLIECWTDFELPTIIVIFENFEEKNEKNGCLSFFRYFVF